MEADPFDLVGGVLDGKYRIDGLAGVGRFNVLYRASHFLDKAPVAVQCLRLPASLDGARVRALAETFQAAGRLHQRLAQGSRHIAHSFAVGSAPAKTGAILPFFVRAWLPGESLAGDLARRRSDGKKGRDVEEALALLAPAFEAAVHAQAAGEVHLSLNPSNLFLVQHDGHSSLQVLDFGVARAINELRLPLPEYAAPEQLDPARGIVGPWTDVYSLAIVTLEVLSDRSVLSGREAALDEGQRPTPRALGLALPIELDHALTRAVSSTPERRQRSVGELWNALRTARGRPPTVVGAVPGSRLFVSSALGGATMPMRFEPGTPKPSAQATRVDASPTGLSGSGAAPVAPPIEVDRPLVQALTTPLPPRVETPLLPPVVVVMTPANPFAARSPSVADSPSPSATAVIEARRGRRIGTVIVSAMVGLGAGAGLAMLAFQLRAASAPAIPPELRTLVAAAPAPAPAPAPASASAPASAPASASAPAPAPASAPASAPDPAPASDRAPMDYFPAATASKALDALGPVVAKCRRGKVWGGATATVGFANDGTVSRVVFGLPFTGSPTGECVSQALATVRVGAYEGKGGVLRYRFFVAPK